MGPVEAVKIVLSKYIVGDGRARRAEYWWFVLFVLLASFAIGIVEALVLPSSLVSARFGGPLSAIFSLAVFLPSICVAIRRLHDLNRSGWWVLLALVPVVNLGLVIYFIFPGSAGANRFGPDPLQGGVAGYAPSVG